MHGCTVCMAAHMVNSVVCMYLCVCVCVCVCVCLHVCVCVWVVSHCYEEREGMGVWLGLAQHIRSSSL